MLNFATGQKADQAACDEAPKRTLSHPPVPWYDPYSSPRSGETSFFHCVFSGSHYK